MKNWVESSSKKILLAVILLIIILAVFFIGMIIPMIKVYPESYTQDPYPPYEGTLDRHTAYFLNEQDYFVFDLSNILTLDPAGQNMDQENDGRSLSDRIELMEDRLHYMESINVAAPFSNYKQEVVSYFSDVTSSLDAMLETGEIETNQLQALYSGLMDFVDGKTDDLPALFDELGVEYTIEEDESGGEIVNYRYTDVMPML